MTKQPRLYVILGSHACRTGMLLLEHKGIDYRTVRLPTGMHPLAVRALGFGRDRRPARSVDGERSYLLAAADGMGTVPALQIDGRRISTNRAIARFLDELQPDPPLFPADPQLRAAVEEAERWGDEELQMVARRLVLAGARRADDGRLGPLLFRHETVRRGAVSFFARHVFAADARRATRLQVQLPAMLERVDAWIAEGVLGGAQLNAADYMIVTSLALLSYVEAVRPQLEDRPLTRLLDRVLPEPVTSG